MLSRRDPIRDFFNMRRSLDRMFEGNYSDTDEYLQGYGLTFPLDVSETNEAYMIYASLPGINPDEVDITYSGSTLTIRGNVHSEHEREGERYHVRERRSGTFARSITLPDMVDANGIDARYENGVLTLRLPKAEDARPRRITIQPGSMGETKRMGSGNKGNVNK